MEINKNTSYLIGFFQSDGHMSKGTKNKGRASIEISKKDDDIIYKIKELIKYNYSIRERKRSVKIKDNEYLYETISINIYNLEFRNFLEKNGIPYGKKSKRIEPPDTNELSINDYIRGLFDGDGSLGFTKEGFPYVGLVTESEYIKDYILDYISNITNKERKKLNRNKRDKLYNIVIYKEDAVKFCELVYYKNCLSIDRKYRTSRYIVKWIRPLNMKKVNFKRKKWTQYEDDFIVNNTIEESINVLNRTKKSIEIRKIRIKNNFLY
jgi:hypothetical protein